VLIRIKDFNTDKIILKPNTQTFDSGIATASFSSNKKTIGLLVLFLNEEKEIVDTYEDGPYETGGNIDINLRADAPSEVSSNEAEPVVDINETIDEVEVVVVDETVVESEEETKETLLTGHAFYSKDDGSLNLLYPIGLVVIFLLFILLFIFGRKKRLGGIKLSREDRELKDVEDRIKDKEKQINVIKYGDLKKKKIQEARNKLAQEERELKDIGGRKIEEARNKLAQEERELKDMGDGENVDNSKDNVDEWTRRQE
jgi:hypothetical protein